MVVDTAPWPHDTVHVFPIILSCQTQEEKILLNFQIRYKTSEPVWEENFTFFVHNPKRQDLDIEVFYFNLLSSSNSALGTRNTHGLFCLCLWG